MTRLIEATVMILGVSLFSWLLLGTICDFCGSAITSYRERAYGSRIMSEYRTRAARGIVPRPSEDKDGLQFFPRFSLVTVKTSSGARYCYMAQGNPDRGFTTTSWTFKLISSDTNTEPGRVK